MNRILVVDDESQYVESMLELLTNEGYTVSSADTFEKAMAEVLNFKPHLILLDLDLKDGMEHSGAFILKKIRQEWSKSQLPILVVSGAGDPNLLGQVLGNGANDYQTKPVVFSIIHEKIKRLLSVAPAAPAAHLPWEDKLIGPSPLIMDLAKSVFQAAQAEGDTLFMGETGCGKTQIANLYHQFSPRSNKPFVRIDILPIPHDLFESELFGHNEGAFTGAKNKPGKIDDANCGGILFLDEIGDLDLTLQGKLLTLLDKKTFSRVGSVETLHLNAVILTATNKPLYEMVKKGEFRKDLYYRLHRNVIECPPLREHPEDIPYLVGHYIKKFNRMYNKSVTSASQEVIERLKGLDWDGNVRELIDCVDQGVQKCLDHEIILKDIEAFLQGMQQKQDKTADADSGIHWNVDHKTFREKTLFQMERNYLRHHLKMNGWNVTKTAAAIGQSREYLTELMRRFEIQRPKGEPER